MEWDRDICSHIASIVHDLPSSDNPNASIETEAPAEHVLQDRETHASQLRQAWDEADIEPLLGEVQAARYRMLAAERDLRLLLAYAREFVLPRPYPLEDLARASGMSISGVRTAYDDDDIDAVATVTGMKSKAHSSPATRRRRTRKNGSVN
jgi:hypothetical protein